MGEGNEICDFLRARLEMEIKRKCLPMEIFRIFGQIRELYRILQSTSDSMRIYERNFICYEEFFEFKDSFSFFPISSVAS